MKPVPLDDFLKEMAGLLDGSRSARQVERVLGPSASGSRRLALYATLVERQQHGVLDDFYAAVKVAAGPRFSPLREAYLRAYPPRHWVPSRAAAQFPSFLEQRGAGAALVELADFAWSRHVVSMAPNTDDVSELIVRHYTHAVRAFTREVERDGKTSGRPLNVPETWLLGRSRQTAEVVIVEPSLAALVVIQVLQDRAWSADLPVIPRDDLVREAGALASLGLLSTGAREALEGWLP
ncbi:MAG: hypothetical protein Q8N23_12030 [Archangium sp.]|nr:hypothetical protein [Archangium sp.]MDP3573446.1 hypothetical protein [Archangium sp.]